MPLSLGLALGLEYDTGSTSDSASGGNPLDNVARASFLFDVPRSQYRNGVSQVGSFSSLTGLTFTRALAAYAPNSAGVLQLFASGAPRITDRGLLIEGARTNLCLRSQEFDNASWSKTNITVTADAIAAPDGTLTADLLTVTTTAGTNVVQAVGAVSGTNCCASIYVQNFNRSDTSASFFLRDLTAAAIKVTATVNWSNMTVSGAGASIERLGSTNWYRIIMIDTAWTSGNSAQIYAGASGASLTAGLGWYPWGAQVEAAAFPSSYIPTTSASVTRPADVCSIAVSGISYPATLFAEFERVVDTGGDERFLALSNTSADRVYLRVLNTDNVNLFVGAGGVSQASESVTGSVALGVLTKAAGRVATDDVKAARGGTLSTGDTSSTNPVAPNKINIGTDETNLSALFGFIKRAAVWNGAFTDAQLQAVST